MCVQVAQQYSGADQCVNRGHHAPDRIEGLPDPFGRGNFGRLALAPQPELDLAEVEPRILVGTADRLGEVVVVSGEAW
jgi:hypothetical protein